MLVSTVGAPGAGKPPQVPTFANPVFPSSAPDPAVLRAPDGSWRAYTTDTHGPDGKFRWVPELRSNDLMNWSPVGDALPKLPAWSKGGVWAPHVTAHGDGYLMYFSARIAGTKNFGIGVARSATPDGPFEPMGQPIVSGTGTEAIDPFVTQVSGRPVLYYGSRGAPIRAVPLGEDGLSAAGVSREVLTANPTADGYERLIEGPWLHERDGWWYMFYSGDRFNKHYALMVARSRDPLGTFERNPAGPILTSNDAFVQPGHNAVATDDKGTDWAVYHAYPAQVPEGTKPARQLLIDRIEWKDGWPVINQGRGPSSTPQAPPTAHATAKKVQA